GSPQAARSTVDRPAHHRWPELGHPRAVRHERRYRDLRQRHRRRRAVRPRRDRGADVRAAPDGRRAPPAAPHAPARRL
ncbi:MAG: hypothetical protein AVDCRST_MAG67-3096, partial [uncultured Solirubrobacteraceae bacterium]